MFHIEGGRDEPISGESAEVARLQARGGEDGDTEFSLGLRERVPHFGADDQSRNRVPLAAVMR